MGLPIVGLGAMLIVETVLAAVVGPIGEFVVVLFVGSSCLCLS